MSTILNIELSNSKLGYPKGKKILRKLGFSVCCFLASPLNMKELLRCPKANVGHPA